MKKGNLWVGLAFILAAVYVVLDAVGIGVGIGLWQVIFTIIMISILVGCIREKRFISCIIPVCILLIIYAEPLHLEDYAPGTILAVGVLLAIGLSIIKGGRTKKHNVTVGFDQNDFDNEDFGETETIYDNAPSFKVNFSAASRRISTDDFKSAQLSCHFGALKIYLDDAIMQDPSATVTLDVSFSGVEIRVPKNWRVNVQASSTAGGIEEKGSCNPDATKVLYINGNVNLGGVTIMYV